MTVRPSEVTAVLLDRIRASYPAPAVFSHAETHDWPPGALSQLLHSRILQPGVGHIAPVVCPGCELQCQKTVVIRGAGPKRRAFVICDEPPLLGRVEIAEADLVHYEGTLCSVATFLCRDLKQPAPRRRPKSSAYALGVVRGRYGPRTVSVGCNDGAIHFNVDQHSEPLERVLRWDGDAFSLDKALIRRMASRKSGTRNSARGYQSDRGRQSERSRQTAQRDRTIYKMACQKHRAGEGSWSAIAKDIAATKLEVNRQGKPIDPATVRRIITQMRTLERNNSPSKPRTRK